MGMDIINPGTPQIYPQSISMINTVTVLIENVFPIIIGSSIPPKRTCTPVMIKQNKANEPVESISAKEKTLNTTVEIIEPII